MLRFILDVLLLRKLIDSPFARFLAAVFFVGCLLAGIVYAGIVFHAVSERSSAPHVHTHSTH
jgi:hypothetical protein